MVHRALSTFLLLSLGALFLAGNSVQHGPSDSGFPKFSGDASASGIVVRSSQSSHGQRGAKPVRAGEPQSPGNRVGKGKVVSLKRPAVPAMVYESELVSEQPRLVRKMPRRADTELITPNLHRVWIARGNDSLSPREIEMIEVENGFDLVFEFNNNTTEAKRLGEIVVGGIRFPETITTRAIFNDGKPLQLSHSNAPYFGGGATYPGALYSPVAIVQSGQDTIGMSLLYDVREYRHGVFIRVESPGGIYTHGGRNWQTRFVFDRDDKDEGGRIQPGESRTYRVCVRVHHGDSTQWVRTLVPYRDFFASTYGPVRYERDPRPVRGAELAQVAYLSQENPRGFLGGDDRLDLAGFLPLVEQLYQHHIAGFDRFMIWQPTGLYLSNRASNYPFNFTTGWDSIPMLNDTKDYLTKFASSGAELGLWWGNTSFVMPREWDAGPRQRFDPRNPDHVSRAREEMDGAMGVSAKIIGLDAMSSMPAWDAYEWVLQMQSEYPDTRFIFETLCPDFIHTITPTFVYGTRIPETNPFAATSPMLLADFLNPGHEIWALISGQDVKLNAGLPSTDPVPFNLFYDRCKKAAQDGYIPVVFGPMPTTTDLTAAESWLTTIPADLQR